MIVIIRILLLLIPLLGVIYFLRWRYKLKMSGEDPDDDSIKKVRIILVTILVSLIALGVLLSVVDTNNYDRDKVYVPPHVVDGKVVPGKFIDKDESNEAEADTKPNTKTDDKE